MNLVALKSFGGPRVQRVFLKIAKYSPEILTGVGIAGVVGGTILIARATVDLEAILIDFEIGKDLVDRKKGEINSAGDPIYTEKEIQKDLAHVYVKLVLDLTKAYGPGVSLELASIASILAAHGIMRRRAVALLGAYKAVETAFQEYRKRIASEFGEAKELEVFRGIRTEKIKDEATGKTKTVKTMDPRDAGIFTRVFDEYNPNWRPTPELNFAFLKSQQMYANDRLNIQGHLFLNEVFDSLGFPRQPMGQILGWTLGGDGDNFVDFGIVGDVGDHVRRFVNGEEPSVWLNFNVDGVVHEKI